MANFKKMGICVVGLLFFGQVQVFSQQKLSVPFDVQLCDRNTVMINWTRPAADSVNYVLEKSGDEKIWKVIADINSQLSPCYDYVDLHATTGTAFYRIAQRKRGQLVGVSDSKWIKISKPGKIYLWPTPANDILHVRTPFITGNMDIIDCDGRFIRKITIIDSVTDVPLQAFPNGMYFIHLRHGKDVLVEKFIKQQGY